MEHGRNENPRFRLPTPRGAFAQLRRAVAERPDWMELRVVLALLASAGGIWAFVELADEVVEGETARIDRALLLALRSPADPTDLLGPPWVQEMGRDLTALGSMAVLTLVTVVAVAYLALRGLRRTALLVALAVAGGILVSQGLKSFFERPRPDLVPQGAPVFTESFPSGHAMMSAVVYLTLGALIARVQPQRRMKAFVLTVVVFLALIVGVSRVYLGVHWPSDVLAGWTVGAAWALLCWLVARALQQRGRMDRPPPPRNAE